MSDEVLIHRVKRMEKDLAAHIEEDNEIHERVRETMTVLFGRNGDNGRVSEIMEEIIKWRSWRLKAAGILLVLSVLISVLGSSTTVFLLTKVLGA